TTPPGPSAPSPPGHPASACRRLLTARRPDLLGLLRLLCPVARHVQLDNDAVIHQPVDRRRRRHRVLEDRLPPRERQVARQQHTPPLVPLRQQREQYLHLLPRLLHVPQVVQQQHLVPRQPL